MYFRRILLFFTAILLIANAVAQTDTNFTDAKGKKQGLWRKYDGNVLLYEGKFVNDVPTGKFTYYHKNGKIKSICHFISGTSKVRTELYHENGQKSAEGIFIDQIKDGLWNYYNQNGVLIKVENYKNGERHGEWKTYSSQTGILLEECNYDNGVLNGVEKIYFVNGDLQTEVNYINGKRNGNFKSYYSGNVISSNGVYHNDLPVGEWSYYDGDGQIRKSEIYKDGKVENTYLYFYNGSTPQKVNIDIIAYIQKADDKSKVVMMSGAVFLSTDDFVYLKTLVGIDNFCPVTPNLVAANSAIRGYKQIESDRILVKLVPTPDYEVYSEGVEAHFVKMLFEKSPIEE